MTTIISNWLKVTKYQLMNTGESPLGIFMAAATVIFIIAVALSLPWVFTFVVGYVLGEGGLEKIKQMLSQYATNADKEKA